MAETTKNYLRWSAKAVTTQYGTLINLSISKEELNKLPVSEKGFIRITIAERKEIGQYGDTHSIFENTFVPTKQATPAPKVSAGEEELFS